MQCHKQPVERADGDTARVEFWKTFASGVEPVASSVRCFVQSRGEQLYLSLLGILFYLRFLFHIPNFVGYEMILLNAPCPHDGLLLSVVIVLRSHLAKSVALDEHGIGQRVQRQGTGTVGVRHRGIKLHRAGHVVYRGNKGIALQYRIHNTWIERLIGIASVLHLLSVVATFPFLSVLSFPVPRAPPCSAGSHHPSR